MTIKNQIFLSLLIISATTGCNGPADSGPETFYAAMIADVHIYPSTMDFKEKNVAFMEKGDSLSGFSPGIDMVFSLGDNLEDLMAECEADKDIPAMTHYKYLIDQYFQMPYYIALGNHDNRTFDTFTGLECPKKRWVETFKDTESIPAPYYSIEHKGFNFIVFDPTDEATNHDNNDWFTISEEQLVWAAGELEKGLPSILIWHHYIHFKEEITDDSHPVFSLIETYKDNIKAVFMGHSHSFVKSSWHGIDFYETGTFLKYPDSGYYILELNADASTVVIYNEADLTYENIDRWDETIDPWPNYPY